MLCDLSWKTAPCTPAWVENVKTMPFSLVFPSADYVTLGLETACTEAPAMVLIVCCSF